MSDDWLIDKFRLHHSDKPFHGGVKQYQTHTRTATITTYLISYIHYKLQTKLQNETTTETTMYNNNLLQHKQDTKNSITKLFK